MEYHLSCEKFAHKYADNQVDIGIKKSRLGRIVGYDNAYIVIEIDDKDALGALRVGNNIGEYVIGSRKDYFTPVVSRIVSYVIWKDKHNIKLVSTDNYEPTQSSGITIVSKKQISHYPDTCPRKGCGNPAYLRSSGGVDCSSKICNHYAR